MACRDNVERLERGSVNSNGKEHFTSLYSSAKERAFTKRNTLAGWSKSGLFPCNPHGVLKDLLKPPLAAPSAGQSAVGPVLHGVPSTALSKPGTSVKSPVTPVSVAAMMLLQTLILEQDAHMLDQWNKHSLQRPLRKPIKAAQTFIAKDALQYDQI